MDYRCDLSGVEREGGVYDESDGLMDLPPGWVEVRIVRRAFNPDWLRIQQLKQGTVSAILASLPPALQDEQRDIVTLQVSAQYYAIEKDTPVYTLDVDEVLHVADDAEVVTAFNEIRESMGLEPLPIEDEAEAESPTEVAAEEAPAPAAPSVEAPATVPAGPSS